MAVEIGVDSFGFGLAVGYIMVYSAEWVRNQDDPCKILSTVAAMVSALVAVLTLSSSTLKDELIPATRGEKQQIVIVDGDELRLGRTQIRLWGIEAPGLGQQCERAGAAYDCGDAARDALIDLMSGGPIQCEVMTGDEYGRIVARCFVNGVDIGGEMVRRGWALHLNRDSIGAYAQAHASAMRSRRGLWAGSFVLAWGWRAEDIPYEAPRQAAPHAGRRRHHAARRSGAGLRELPPLDPRWPVVVDAGRPARIRTA